VALSEKPSELIPRLRRAPGNQLLKKKSTSVKLGKSEKKGACDLL
jgi:hypothetical protein